MWTLALVALLAGCTDPNQQGADPQGRDDPQLPANGATITFAECYQFHTLFTARAEDFQVPNGFTIRSDDAGLTTLYLVPSLCKDRAGLVISIPVIPPANQTVEGHDHHFVLELYADENTTPTLLKEGIQAVACGCHLDFFGDAHPVFHMEGGGHAYTVRFLVAPSSGPFTEGPIAYFSGDGDRLLVQSEGNATNLGLGTVVVAYSGPGGAPPASVGNIAHAVHGLTFSWEVQ